MRIRNSLVKKSQNIKMYVFLYFCLLIKMQDTDTIKGMAKNIHAIREIKSNVLVRKDSELGLVL